MMQSTLADTAAKINRLLFIYASQNHSIPFTRRLGAITGGGRTVDPAIHAVDPEEKDDASEAAKAAPKYSVHQSVFKPSIKNEDPYVPPKISGCPPSESSPKIRGTGENHPPEPITQQKRRRSHYSNSPSPGPAVTEPATDVNCTGFDGTPLPEEKQQLDRQRQNEEQVEDYRQYFQQHKASPLSGLKMVDTRKPITMATDGTADSYYGTPEMALWRPEQLDTAEDSCAELWRYGEAMQCGVIQIPLMAEF